MIEPDERRQRNNGKDESTEPEMQSEGGEVSPSTPEEFAAFLRADVDRWTKMVKQTGITLD